MRDTGLSGMGQRSMRWHLEPMLPISSLSWRLCLQQRHLPEEETSALRCQIANGTQINFHAAGAASFILHLAHGRFLKGLSIFTLRGKYPILGDVYGKPPSLHRREEYCAAEYRRRL